MNKILALCINDFKNIFRDKSLIVIFFIPLLFILMLRYILPVIILEFPVVEEYKFLILTFFCTMTVVFPAFIISFIMLDERDENVLTVLRIVPVSPLTFIVYRMMFVFLFGFAFSALTMFLSGAINISAGNIFLISFLLSMMSPIATLFVVSIAKNKIEGVTIFKGLNFVLMLPLLSFFTESVWRNLIGIVPVYWTYRIMYNIINNYNILILVLISFVCHSIFIYALYNRFRKKVF